MAEKFHNPSRYLFWGLVFILGGGAWRLSLMGWFDLSWEFVLPGVLIILGLSLLVSGLFRQRRLQSETPMDTSQGGQS